MALSENESVLRHVRAFPYTASATITGEVIRSSAMALLHTIIIGSHTALSFKLWNSATGAANPIGSTYTPAAGSSVINFTLPIEFSNGIYVTSAGSFRDGANGSGLTFLVN